MAQDKKKKEKQRQIPFFLYWLACNIFYLYLKITCGLRLDRSAIKDLEDNWLVVANHQSLTDFGAVTKACLPRRLTFVISSHFFHHDLLSKIFYHAGAISKRQFVADLPALRKMMRAAKQGASICIFPEGQVCYSGENAAIDPEIGKLAKLLGLPVVNIRIRGNYLRRPKWACGKVFPSSCEAVAEVLLTKEEVVSLSAEELGKRIIAGVSYDEFEWQRERMVPSRKPRSAEGLESILFLCPHCGAEQTLSASGRRLTCSRCGFAADLDDYGFFRLPDGTAPEYDTVSGWMRWQSRHLAEQLEEGTLLPIVSEGRWMESALGEYEEHGYHCHGRGTGVLDKDGFTFTGERDGEPYTYHIDPNGMWDVTHNADLASISLNGNCEGDKDYAFDPDEPRLLMKYVQSWPLIREKYFRNS